MSDSDGNQIGYISYFPFGATHSGSVPTDKKFTGQRLDDSGLYYYGARYYDPTIGRFISGDSIVPDPYNPQALNRYSYVLNNPLKYVDHTGHWAECSYGPCSSSCGWGSSCDWGGCAWGGCDWGGCGWGGCDWCGCGWGGCDWGGSCGNSINIAGISECCNEFCHGNEQCVSLCENILSELHATSEQKEYSKNWVVWMLPRENLLYTSRGQIWARMTVIRGKHIALVVIDTYTHTDYPGNAAAWTSAKINYNWGKSAKLSLSEGGDYLQTQAISQFGFRPIPAAHASDMTVIISLCVGYNNLYNYGAPQSGSYCPSFTTIFPGFSFPEMHAR